MEHKQSIVERECALFTLIFLHNMMTSYQKVMCLQRLVLTSSTCLTCTSDILFSLKPLDVLIVYTDSDTPTYET